MRRLNATSGLRGAGAALIAVAVLAGSATAQPAAEPEPVPAEEPGAAAVEVSVRGHLQLWWTVFEQAENGLLQPITADEAADVTSGFSLRRARLASDFETSWMRARLSLRLENSPPGLLDAYLAVPLYRTHAELWVGQMKVPSTYEVARSSQALDFITRSLFSQRVVDLALISSPSLSSPRFAGVRTYLRDTGVALKGSLRGGSYFLMVGNGLGANSFIGGPEMKQEMYTNSFGAYFYAARVGYAILGEQAAAVGYPVAVEAGAHASYNYHPNALLDDERTVVDVERMTWSTDLRVAILDRARLHAMFGAGSVGDEIDYDGRDDYRFTGWDVGVVVAALPGLVDVGVRYDGYAEERYENGFIDTLHTVTAGASYRPRPRLELELNYKWKHLDSDSEPEIDDNALLLMVQGRL